MDVQQDAIFLFNKEFELPERNDSSRRVVAYLSKRGIHRSVIDFCLESGRLYESRPYHNAVFVGFDLQGVPRYAAIRGTSTTRYLGEVSGSDKRYAFSIAAQKNSQDLHLFESAIDLLSYCTMERLSGADWNQAHLLSLAGINKPSLGKVQAASPAALTQYLKACPECPNSLVRALPLIPCALATLISIFVFKQTHGF